MKVVVHHSNHEGINSYDGNIGTRNSTFTLHDWYLVYL